MSFSMNNFDDKLDSSDWKILYVKYHIFQYRGFWLISNAYQQ